MRRRKHVIGITGNIATGKSTVVKMLEQLGAEAIDADALVHSMMGPDSQLADAIEARFGSEVVNADRSINRPALGRIVFSDPAGLEDLEVLIHPFVVEHMRSAAERPEPPVLVLDAIKLFEAGISETCDTVWVVDADRETQIERIIERNEVDRAEAERRIDAQPPQSEKLARADVVVNNAGSLDQTRRQVHDAWERIVAPALR